MKHSRTAVHRKTHKLPTLRFADQHLTSFAGLIVFQQLFAHLRLKARVRTCFAHLGLSPIFGHHVVVLLLVVHLLVGYRELRDSRYYRDDPLVKRLLGLQRLPDVATVSRTLASADARSIAKLRQLCRDLVCERLCRLRPRRLTLDFDGSVQSTGRAAEGTAVGFNKQKKGARSYYPLFCTVAQTGQVFDLLHRAGNVHDSNGAAAFIVACIEALRAVLPGVRIEARLDSAFFSDAIVTCLEAHGVAFTISVPFERFVALKGLIEGRRRWRRFNATLAFFETAWKPQCWDTRYRFLFIRQTVARQQKGPVQLDLFIPHALGYDFKVLVTNQRGRMQKVLAFHNGRGAQEGIFAELKSQCQMDYVPVRTLVGNQLYILAAILAHNCTRELQMVATPPQRPTTEKRTPLWIFQELQTIRRTLVQRAGRLTRPRGQLTLTMSANAAVRDQLLHYLAALRPAA
jgi:hypothetical protein